MTEWGLNLYWKSLLARIATLERYGVIFTLDEDGEGMEVRIPKALHNTGIREGIRNDKPALLEAVRLREGLCVVCGMDAAKRPARKGKAENWDWSTMKVASGDVSSLCVYPMYCTSCWESRLMWRGLLEKNVAKSTETRAEGACSSSDAPIRRGRQTVTDPDGDSGRAGVEVLAFTAD